MLSPPPLALYIHLPWCVRKCPYCDFNSHALRSELPEQAYIEALLSDLEQDLEKTTARPLSSIFFGGGTPSLFSPDSLESLLAGIRTRIAWTDSIEITLEANPGAVERHKFKEFREIGINRLSLGIQSFHDTSLAALGRIHDGHDALTAVHAAREAGFSNLNLDLMFGLPGQDISDALRDVETAIELNPTHISYYQLTLEPNTLFSKYPPPLPPEDTLWKVQQSCQQRLGEAGYAQYEISAHAREGYQCRHNLGYWRFDDYLGIGAGAHSKLTFPAEGGIRRLWKVRHPLHYLEKARGPQRIGGHRPVPKEERPLEFFMNALRLAEGFSVSQFEQRTGLPFRDMEDKIEELIGEHWLLRRGDRIRCSRRGWNFLDSLLQHFTPP